MHHPSANAADAMRTTNSEGMKKVCIVGASGKLGQYMVQHALERGYEVVGVCRKRGVGKLDTFERRIAVIPGRRTTRGHQEGGRRVSKMSCW